MTKEQLMQFIEVDSEEDKDDCEFYLDVKGVEIHRAIMEYLQFDFLEGSKIKWSIISQKLKEDKRLRDKLYIYLATFEEYIRAYISNKYQGNIHQNFWIDGKAPWNKIKEIAANNTELEKQCADDKAEFISIKKSIPSEDMVAVQAERYTIHDEYTKSNIQKLQEKYGRKYSYDIYKDVEADVNMELHEKPFSILMRLEKNKQRNTDHNHTKYRNHEQER